MASKFKVDLSGVKNFFFEKGDKVALVLCLAVSGVLVGYGVMSGMGARSAPGGGTFGDSLARKADALKLKLEQGANVPKVDPPVLPNPSWVGVTPSKEDWSKLFYVTDNQTIKRLNPQVLAARNSTSAERKEVQMDYVRGTYFAYEIDHGNKAIWIIKDKPAVTGLPEIPLPKQKKDMLQKKEVTPTIVTRPVRMVVVHMVVPLRDQLVEFQRAFRMKSLHEVFESKDLPKFLGINVWKTEVAEGAEEKADWKPFIVHNPKTDKVDISSGLREVLREAFYDDEATTEVQPYLLQGLATPLPKLAIIPTTANPKSYPEVKLAGMEFDWINGAAPALPQMTMPAGMQGGKGGGAMPNMQGGAGAEVEFQAKPWRGLNLQPQIAEKLEDNIYVLDPLGINPDPDVPMANRGPGMAGGGGRESGGGGLNSANPYAGNSPFAAFRFWEMFPPPPAPLMPAAGPGGPGGERPKGSMPQASAGGQKNAQTKPWDGLLRFFDPDVKPGKTYKYLVQIRMANPNYNKKNDVAFAALATIAELQPSAPVETPTISIPGEFNLYAVDHKPDPKLLVKNGSDSQKAKSDQVAVQIQRWVDETTDLAAGEKFVVGDWAIAERLLVRRGDPVGRVVNVEVPVWKKDKNNFELGVTLENAVMRKKLPPGAKAPAPVASATTIGTGIPVDFSMSNPPPSLVDFDGGEREVKLGGSNTAVKDDSASNLLILQSDGKLIVRNSRVDADPTTPESVERLQRIEQWKEKTGKFRQQDATPNSTPGFFTPKKGGSS